MDTEIKVVIIEKMPTYVAILFLISLLIFFSKELVIYIDRISSVEIGGVVLKFSDSAAPEEFKKEILNYEPGQALKRRLSYLGPRLRNSSMLVVHDNPRDAEWLAGIFRELGMSVNVAICSSETEQKMKQHYDVVLSDIRWSRCKTGAKSSKEVFNKINPSGSRIVFYIGNLEGNEKRIPLYARELTNTFDGMLNGVLDVIARSNRLAF